MPFVSGKSVAIWGLLGSQNVRSLPADGLVP
jgi:hypothetical protein